MSISIPLFTHQCGGCKPLMDLHPALRDYHANQNGPDATDDRPEEAARATRSAVYRTRLASACVACAALALGSLLVF